MPANSFFISLKSFKNWSPLVQRWLFVMLLVDSLHELVNVRFSLYLSMQNAHLFSPLPPEFPRTLQSLQWSYSLLNLLELHSVVAIEFDVLISSLLQFLRSLQYKLIVLQVCFSFYNSVTDSATAFTSSPIWMAVGTSTSSASQIISL